MQNASALNVPQRGPTISSKRVAYVDVVAGMGAIDIWGRLCWRETKRRYRRTAFGPFWTTVSLAFFITTLGLGVVEFVAQGSKDFPAISDFGNVVLGLLSCGLHGRLRQLFRIIRKAHQAVANFLYIARERGRLAQYYRLLSQLDHLCRGRHLRWHLD